jgi:hypothetical protein
MKKVYLLIPIYNAVTPMKAVILLNGSKQPTLRDYADVCFLRCHSVRVMQLRQDTEKDTTYRYFQTDV